MPRKADADEILEHMHQLPSSLKLDRNRRFWPNWLFRSDHVENAAAILNTGRLLSRAAAEHGHLIPVDSGSPHYVGHLSSAHRNLVRLYFRPRTPTQYVNEGIRPQGEIQYDAHMPVPVYLLFASSLLAEQGVSFTKGRLTEATEVGDSAEFLRSIDFGDVYHDHAVGKLGESVRRSTILNARHSEVVVENELPLDQLKHIVCRSAPERETLLNLLSTSARHKWLTRIHTDEGDRRLFEKRGTFVQRADLSNAATRFWFYSNIPRKMRGPFDLRIKWFLDGRAAGARQENFTVSNAPVAYSLGQSAPTYSVRVWLDSNLAYFGHFDEKYESGILL